MDVTVKSGDLARTAGACVVVGILESKKLTPAAESIDKVSRGFIAELMKRIGFNGKCGETVLLHKVPGTSADRVLMVGCGKPKELSDKAYRKINTAAADALCANGIGDATIALPELEVAARDLHWKIRQTVEIVRAQSYRFDRLKSKNDPKPLLRKIALILPDKQDAKVAKAAIAEGNAVAEGVALARDLGNLPGNICTPTYLADQAKKLAKRHPKLTAQVLGVADMEKLKMGALLSVARGSRQPAKLIIMKYNGASAKKRPYVLVGKGITFDSGGISIKPAAAMDEMKYDMCGAASVFGTLSAVAAMRLPINVVGVVPSCENLPDGNASKPGDIVSSMSGQTIEILNTDAEGRLILCDALTYSERFKPETVIDIATLTGACVIALGKPASGLLTNDDKLATDIIQAGENTGDRVWQLPLWDDYQDQIKSPFADMANVGGREAGTITAACFLSRFTEKFRWAHLDIAGTAWISSNKKGATGRPVPLLTQYLLDRCGR